MLCARSAAVPETMVCDNLKAGITATAVAGRINCTYQELAEHYGTAILPAGYEEAARQGEGESGGAKRPTVRVGAAANRLFSLDELNAASARRLPTSTLGSS